MVARRGLVVKPRRRGGAGMAPPFYLPHVVCVADDRSTLPAGPGLQSSEPGIPSW